MEYIVHHRCRAKAAYGGDLNIPYGRKFQTIGNFIATEDGKGLCYTTSETAYKYFARNDDGRGLERGKLTHAIAYSERRREWKNGEVHRFSEAEAETLETEYSRWLRDDVDTIIFNRAFFDAEPEELAELAKRLNIKVR